MTVKYHVHDPLLNRLRELVQQRPFYDRPKLAWITENYLDAESLDRLVRIAPAYGVRVLVFGDEFFKWGTIVENTAIGNWLAGTAEQVAERELKLGVLAAGRDEKEKLEKDFFSRWRVPVCVFSKEENPILDGIANRFGGGRLPYLAMDTLCGKFSGGGMGNSYCPCEEDTATEGRTRAIRIAHATQPILVQVDRPGVYGESLASWGNVFGISYHLMTGISEPEKIEEEYLKTCFGPIGSELHKVFSFARLAIEKSFRVLGEMDLMENGCWPESLEWLDRQLNFNITRDILSRIDLEKIEALEAAHDAWKLLDTLRPQIEPKAFLWLEHFFLQLKTVCQILRLLAETYFAHRGLVRGTANLPSHVMWSKFKDFAAAVREHQALLTAFSPQTPAAGADPLRTILNELKPEK